MAQSNESTILSDNINTPKIIKSTYDELSDDINAISKAHQSLSERVDRSFNATADAVEKLSNDFYEYCARTDKLLSAMLTVLMCDTAVTVSMVIIFLVCR